MKVHRFVVLLVLIAVALTPAVAEGAYPGRNGLLAVVARAPGASAVGGRIDLITPAGRLVRSIPCRPTCRDLWPAWSPTGRRLAFNIEVGPRIRIAIVRADGRGLRVLPGPATSVDAVVPAWSPNGLRLAFGASGFDVTGIWSSNLRGTGIDQLSSIGQQPAWSAGGRIAFTASGPTQIWTMNADGGGRRQITHGTADRTDPDWAPNGKKIAFTLTAHGRTAVWTMRSDGSGARRLASGSNPAWSPDGKQIAFQRGSRIYVMSATGHGTRLVPYAPRTRGGRLMSVSLPDWQPIPVARPFAG